MTEQRRDQPDPKHGLPVAMFSIPDQILRALCVVASKNTSRGRPASPVQWWTEAETKALHQAMRLSTRAFAAHLGVDARSVNKWEARLSTITLRPDTQALMDTALDRAPDDVKARFTQTPDSTKQEQPTNQAQLVEPAHNLHTGLALRAGFLPPYRGMMAPTPRFPVCLAAIVGIVAYMAREAVAHIGHGDVNRACAVGLWALAIGAETRSARIMGELKHLDNSLRKFPSSPSVADFHEAMHATFSRWAIWVRQSRGKVTR